MTLRYGCLLLIACVAIRAQDLQQAVRAYQDLYQLCVTEGKRMDPAVTANILNGLESHFKDYPEAFLKAGDFYFRIGESDQAIVEYRKGMTADGAHKTTYQKRIIEVLIRQKKAADAYQLNQEILQENPQDAEARGFEASVLLDKGEVDAALTELQAVVKAAPENFVARFNLGRVYFNKGEMDQARTQFEAAIKLRPDYMPARLALTQLATKRGDLDLALKYAQENLKIDPSNGASLLLEAAALLRKGEYGEARALLERILQKNPNQVDTLLELGVLDLTEKRYAEAEEPFRKAYTVDPANPRGLLGLAEIRFAQNEPEKAVQVVADEARKQPQRADLQKELANVELRAKQYEKAIADYRSLLDRYKESPAEQAGVYRSIGLAYSLQNQTDQAVENMQKAHELAPANVTYISTLADFYDKAGKPAQAITAYRDALQIDPNNAVVMNNLAYLIANTGGDLDEALALALRAREKLPKLSEILDTVGMIYLKKDLIASAVEVFRDLNDQVKENSTFHYHYAMALAGKGDKGGALEELQRALECRPGENEANQIKELIQKLQ